MRETIEVYELLQDPNYAVPAAILLLSLAALALILYLQEREEAPEPANGERSKEVSNPGGTVFVEDDEGHTVRRSKRERKSVARFAPDNNYQGQFVDPTTPHGKLRFKRQAPDHSFLVFFDAFRLLGILVTLMAGWVEHC